MEAEELKNAYICRLHIPRELLEGDKKVIPEEEKPSASHPVETEENMSMVHGSDNNEDVDPDDDVDIPEPEPPKTSTANWLLSTLTMFFTTKYAYSFF